MEKKIEIKTQEALGRVIEHDLNNGYRGFTLTCLCFDGFGNCRPIPTAMPSGFISPYIEKKIKSMYTIGTLDGGMTMLPRHFDGMVEVQVDDPKALGILRYQKILRIYETGMEAMYLKGITDDESDVPFFEGYFVSTSDPDKVRDVCRNVILPTDYVMNSQLTGEPRRVIEYNTRDLGRVTASPGMTKAGAAIFPGKGCGTDWKKVFHDSSSGGWDLITQFKDDPAFRELLAKECEKKGVKINLDDLTGKETADFATRWGHLWAPCVWFDETPIQHFVIHGGKFVDEEGFEFMDGTAFVDKAFVAKTIENHPSLKGRYHIDPDACWGKVFQDRSFGVCKDTVMADEQAWIQRMVEVQGYERGYKDSYLYRDTCTEEEKMHFVLFCLSKGKLGKYAKTELHILHSHNVAKDSDIDMYVDFNALKTAFDPSVESGMHLLQTSHKGNTTGHIGTQTIQSMAVADLEGTKELVEELSRHMAEKKLTSIIREEGSIPAIEDFIGEHANCNQMVDTVAPEWSLNCWEPAFQKRARKAVEGVCTAVNTLSLETPYRHLVLAPDDAMFFGKHILKQHEDGQADVLVADMKKNAEMILNKFPKQHYEEFVWAVNTGFFQYQQAIAESDLSDEDKRLLVRRMAHTGIGVIKIPAYDQMMHKIAGADYDIDSVSAFTDKRIVSLYKKLECCGCIYIK